MRLRFADCFPTELPPVTELPTDVYHRFNLKDASVVIQRRQYESPKKYRETWKRLLQEHIDAGRLRPSCSSYVSPCFLIPKADPTADPRWVNDYRLLNDNTVPDVHPLPSINEILSDCGKGRIWGKIDMTNSFFQTRVHPDDIHYTAITTPYGLYEWTVMPQGCRNAPATHQRRMFQALRPYIGSICHVYLDDIIIWSNSVEEHRHNVATILSALRSHHLYCSPKKTQLFCTDLSFLGHRISRSGIEADTVKVDKILSWPTPRNASDVRSFLGLMRYISSFLPALAHHTLAITPLTTKEAEKTFAWTPSHQAAFDSIKQIVTSRECLTVIDHANMGRNRVFVSTDASNFATGAVLSYGELLESARPVAFDSMQLKGTELNYPVHEKELLAIVCALKHWRTDLLGVPFTVYTDHRTLENFMTQKHLSRRQARWQEFLSQYDYRIVYVRGEDNTAADALSRLCPDAAVVDATTVAAVGLLRSASLAMRTRPHEELCAAVATRLRIASDPRWLTTIREGYATDAWCRKLLASLASGVPGDASHLLETGALDGKSAGGVSVRDRLLFVADRLVIPRVSDLREHLFRLAHDALGHMGFDKSYAALRDAFYWPNLRRDLENLYVPSCDACQRNKTLNVKPVGPLHPLPVPDARGDSVAIDFVGRLPEDDSFDCIATMTCRLGSDIRVVPCRTDISAEDFAVLFFTHWYCENGLPRDIVSDRDKLFVSRFWKALHRLTGVKVKLSSAYHPETDGGSERTNRTIIQMLRYHVTRQQRGWVSALPLIRFQLMNTVHASTGFTPFQLRLGRSPRLIPPLFDSDARAAAAEFGLSAEQARALLQRIDTYSMEAQDNLFLAKSNQALYADAHRSPEVPHCVGDHVLLSTFHRRRDYMQRGDHRVAKFMVRYDGPYRVIQAWPDSSTYTLDLPDSMNIFPTFHASLLRPYRVNDPDLFPGREHPLPGPVVTTDGQVEWEIKCLLDRRRRGRGWQYLVRWKGYPPSADSWVAGSEVADCEALDIFLAANHLPMDGL